MENKQTAVEYIFKTARLDMGIYDWLLRIEYAEKIEKEQIGRAYQEGLIDGMNHAPKDYYNETYGKEDNDN